MSKQTLWQKFLSFFTFNKLIVLGTLLGVGLGLYAKPLADFLEPVGMSYFSLLMMTILPIVFTSLIINIVNALKTDTLKKRVVKILVYFFVISFVTSFLCLSLTYISKSKLVVTPQAEKIISRKLNVIEYYPAEAPKQYVEKNLSDTNTSNKASAKVQFFLEQVSPKNLFADLSGGVSLKVIIIALFIGVALGVIPWKKQHNLMLEVIDATNKIFNKIFNWLMAAMPIGSCFVTAGSIAMIDSGTLISMLKLAAMMYILMVILAILYVTIFCFQLRISLLEFFKKFKEPTILAFVSSTYIAIPSSVRALKTFKLSHELIDVLVNLGAAANKQGKVLTLSAVTAFIASYYHINLDLTQIFTLCFIIALMGPFATGSGVNIAPILISIASIASIPTAVAIVVLIAVNILAGWVEGVVGIYATFSLLSLTAKIKGAPSR